ncbi:hypothetical protein J6590_090986 [Homalodisca vitripennis]|nr:hypothetical protein J6590_090986 [Homalodisca vitripennis]
MPNRHLPQAFNGLICDLTQDVEFKYSRISMSTFDKIFGNNFTPTSSEGTKLLASVEGRYVESFGSRLIVEKYATFGCSSCRHLVAATPHLNPKSQQTLLKRYRQQSMSAGIDCNRLWTTRRRKWEEDYWTMARKKLSEEQRLVLHTFIPFLTTPVTTDIRGSPFSMVLGDIAKLP